MSSRRSLLFASACSAVLLASCDPTEQGPHDYSEAVREMLAATAGYVVPLDVRQFDLICHTTWQYDAPAPVAPDARAPWPSRARDDRWRIAVDLDLGKYGYIGDTIFPPRSRDLAEASPEEIVLARLEGFVHMIRRRDGVTESQDEEQGRVNVLEGACRRERFSGLPVNQPRRLVPGHLPAGAAPDPFIVYE